MDIQKVLLVDDEPDIRTIGEISLQQVGSFEVRCAKSGGAALELLGEWRPDLVLLDVMMPGMDGPTTLSRIKEQASLADLPVIFLTAKAQKSEVERYEAMGAAGVIRKPFDPLTLPEDIRRILDGTRDRAGSSAEGGDG